MQLKRIASLASVVLTLAACQQESAPPVTSTANGGAATPQVVAAKSSTVITVDPSAMKSCDSIVSTVHWDVSKAGTNTDSTEIWVGTDTTSMKLFSAGGATGETKTGPWTRPGTHFALKNKRDGNTLGEAIVGGPACN